MIMQVLVAVTVVLPQLPLGGTWGKPAALAGPAPAFWPYMGGRVVG